MTALERDIRHKHSEPVELETAHLHRRLGLSEGERRQLRGLLSRGDRMLEVGGGADAPRSPCGHPGVVVVGVDVTEAWSAQRSCMTSVAAEPCR